KQEYAIGITDQDIIRIRMWDVLDLTFTVDTILGFTDNPANTCIVSYARLKDSNTFNRTVNVVMHEMGHIMGLDHCEDGDCLMIPRDHLDSDMLCYRCRCKLKRRKQ